MIRAERDSVMDDSSVAAWTAGWGDLPHRFLQWVESCREEERLWPAFDRFVRDALFDLIGAKHIRVFRVVEGPERIRPLGEDPTAPASPGRGALGGAFGPAEDVSGRDGAGYGMIQAWSGLIDHVLTVGRRYIRGDWSHGELVERLARESSKDRSGIGPPAWVFGVRDVRLGGTPGRVGRRIGLVVIGDVPEASLGDRARLDVLAEWITAFWLHVRDLEWLRLAQRTDRGSGVMNRLDFLEAAEVLVAESRREAEPIVAMALTLEGLRGLDDAGRWEARDRLIEKTGRVLCRKLRSDDCVGRFSDDRFVALLRRLDVSLGRLIALKVIAAVQEALSQEPEGSERITVRCGLAGGAELESTGGLDALLTGALSASGAARMRGEALCVAPAPGSERRSARRDDADAGEAT